MQLVRLRCANLVHKEAHPHPIFPQITVPFNASLLQVVGMTASLGVGDARAGDDAVQFVLHKCATLFIERNSFLYPNLPH